MQSKIHNYYMEKNFVNFGFEIQFWISNELSAITFRALDAVAA